MIGKMTYLGLNVTLTLGYEVEKQTFHLTNNAGLRDRHLFINRMVGQYFGKHFEWFKIEIRGVPGVTRGRLKKRHGVTGSRSFNVTKKIR